MDLCLLTCIVTWWNGCLVFLGILLGKAIYIHWIFYLVTFRHSCLHLSMCSFWVAFGVFVTRIFLEIACFVAFLLISHGYCIMHEQLSTSKRYTIAGLLSLLYLTLIGYKAPVPQFVVSWKLLVLCFSSPNIFLISTHSRDISFSLFNVFVLQHLCA